MPLREIKVLSEDLVTVPEAARQIGKTKKTLYEWVYSGKAVAIELGGVLFVPVSEIKRLQKESQK